MTAHSELGYFVDGSLVDQLNQNMGMDAAILRHYIVNNGIHAYDEHFRTLVNDVHRTTVSPSVSSATANEWELVMRYGTFIFRPRHDGTSPRFVIRLATTRPTAASGETHKWRMAVRPLGVGGTVVPDPALSNCQELSVADGTATQWFNFATNYVTLSSSQMDAAYQNMPLGGIAGISISIKVYQCIVDVWAQSDTASGDARVLHGAYVREYVGA